MSCIENKIAIIIIILLWFNYFTQVQKKIHVISFLKFPYLQ